MMDRLLILLVALAVSGLLWLSWQGVKLWLRRSIRVDRRAWDEKRPTLLYFSSETCVPCRTQQKPVVSRLRQQMGGNIRVEEHDALLNPELARRYRVFTVPTTVVVAPDGRVVAVNYGVTQADKLRRQLAEAGSNREELLGWSYSP
jgi:thioredoxin-like negative regulator of GroEL